MNTLDVPPLLKVFISGHCQNCREAQRLAREIETSYPDVVVQVVNLDLTAVPENYDVFAVPTYVLNDKTLCLGNPKPGWLRQQIDDLLSVT